MVVFDPVPVVLEGTHVRVEPLILAHAADLYEAGNDHRIWEFLPWPCPAGVAEMEEWIREALATASDGNAIVFAIIHLGEGRAVGSTRYLDIQRENRALEIGGTWIGSRHQRSAVNTECKLMLLGHAFEALGAGRVQLKTDLRNEGSQRAIERIGAVREGVLRKHMKMQNDFIRDSVFYSIIATEWPGVKERLTKALAR